MMNNITIHYISNIIIRGTIEGTSAKFKLKDKIGAIFAS